MKLRRKLVGVAVAGALVLSSASGAGAAPGDPAGTGTTAAVSATITTEVGVRAVTALPVTMSSVLGTATLTSALTATVTETARSGTNPWYLTASMSDLTTATTPASTIDNENMAVSGRAVTKTLAGGTVAAPEGSSSLAGTVTLFSNTGQDPALTYTGSYASSSNWTLTPPNLTATGAYTGTITLTINQ